MLVSVFFAFFVFFSFSIKSFNLLALDTVLEEGTSCLYVNISGCFLALVLLLTAIGSFFGPLLLSNSNICGVVSTLSIDG